MIKLQDLIREDFKTKMKKFIESGVDADIVGDYIKKFKKIRDAKFKVALDGEIKGFHINGNDRFNIDKYKTFKELEVFVDYVAGQVKLSKGAGKSFTDIDVSGEALGKKNGLEIYYAKDREACVKYRGGKPYGWCVARSDAGNMYSAYRYAGNEPSFYFVKDVAAMEEEFREPFSGTFKNKWHFFVIQKTGDGYIVTSANNDGDVAMSWDEILKIEPKLEGMEGYFKHVPLGDGEKELYARFKDGIDNEDFVKLSYEDKESYLDVKGIEGINTYQFEKLPRDLKNKYIGFGVGLNEHQLMNIAGDDELMNRVEEMSGRRVDIILKEDLPMEDIKTSDINYFFKNPEIMEKFLTTWVSTMTHFEEVKHLLKVTPNEKKKYFIDEIIRRRMILSEDVIGVLLSNSKKVMVDIDGIINKLDTDSWSTSFDGTRIARKLLDFTHDYKDTGIKLLNKLSGNLNESLVSELIGKDKDKMERINTVIEFGMRDRFFSYYGKYDGEIIELLLFYSSNRKDTIERIIKKNTIGYKFPIASEIIPTLIDYDFTRANNNKTEIIDKILNMGDGMDTTVNGDDIYQMINIAGPEEKDRYLMIDRILRNPRIKYSISTGDLNFDKILKGITFIIDNQPNKQSIIDNIIDIRGKELTRSQISILLGETNNPAQTLSHIQKYVSTDDLYPSQLTRENISTFKDFFK
jgi:hypothetical protein